MRLSTFLIMILLLSGLTYVRNDTWRDNAKLWRDVMRKSPEKIRSYNNFGNALNTENVEIAIKVFEDALTISPKDPVIHYNLGRAFVTKGSFDQAIEHFSAALRYFSDALTYLRSASHKAKTPKYLELTLVDLGAAQFVQGNIASATDNFSRALVFNPQNALAHYNLGVVYAKSSRDELSLYHLNKANEIDPLGFPQRNTVAPALDMHHFVSH